MWKLPGLLTFLLIYFNIHIVKGLRVGIIKKSLLNDSEEA